MSSSQKLWKNIDWKNKDEKQAFFDKYFIKSDIVQGVIDKKLSSFKMDLLGFIDRNTVTEGGKTRPLTLKDVVLRIKE